MPMRPFVSIITFLIIVQFSLGAQEEINNYKYILIPKKFSFLKYEDQYQINSLTEFLFNKYGYKAFMSEDELPEDLSQNRCLALKANVEEVRGGFLKTKLQILLLDCNDKVIAESMIGETRIKEYAKAYNVAVRNAFKTFQYFDYEFNPDNEITSVTTASSNSSQNPKSSDSELVTDEMLAKQEEAEKELKKLKMEVAELKMAKNETPKAANGEFLLAGKALYAQPMDNGFQVVDTEPKKIMFLLKTSLTDVFNVQGKNALVYKKDEKWYYESQDPENQTKEVINLNF